MPDTLIAGPTYLGKALADEPNAFGEFESSVDLMDDALALRERMAAEGYLFLPGLLDSDRVKAARASLLEKLDAEGVLDRSRPRAEGVVKAGVELSFRADLANGNEAIASLLYDGEMMEFWKFFLGGPALHFDFTWLRARTPAEHTVTHPHCDTVYMGRGTPNLYTAWTPLDDVPYDFGGLMILEGSCKREEQLGEYWKMDVDAYCTNGPEREAIESGTTLWQEDKRYGHYSRDPFAVQQDMGGRWLGAEYRMGDLLIFGMHTLHAAADNRTNRIRLSTDSRYQLASEPADDRWIGANPPAHGPAGKRGMIC